MEKIELLEVIKDFVLVVVGGGALAVYNAIRKNKRDDFTTIADTWKQDNTRLREENTNLKASRSALRKELETCKDMQGKFLLVSLASKNLPFPHWRKSNDGEFLWVNDHFERLILKPRGFSAKDIGGKTVFDIFDPETAEKLKAGEMEARNLKGELCETGFRFKTEKGDFAVMKHALFIDDTYVGMEGIAPPSACNGCEIFPQNQGK